MNSPRRPKRGLPYGWWKDPDVWAMVLASALIMPLAWAVLAAWLLDWKAFW